MALPQRRGRDGRYPLDGWGTAIRRREKVCLVWAKIDKMQM